MVEKPTDLLRLLLNEPKTNMLEIARQTGVNKSTLSKIKNGESRIENITAGNFVALAHYFGMSADELYTGKPYTPPSSIDKRFMALDLDGKRRVLEAIEFAEYKQVGKTQKSAAVQGA